VDVRPIGVCGLPASPTRASPGAALCLRLRRDRGVGATGTIVLQAEEISDYRWVSPDEAGRLLSGPVGRRVTAILAIGATAVYLEDGRPVARDHLTGR
jgi:hypothetical protein